MRRYVYLVFCLALSAAFCAHADFSCAATVSYQWKKKEDKEARAVVWIEVAARGETEEAAKAQLAATAASETPRARDACARDHESLASCIAAKFSAQSSLMASLSFSARKALEEAISSDCKGSQGECGTAVLSEARCIENKPASVPAAGGKGEEKGKAAEEPKKKGK